MDPGVSGIGGDVLFPTQQWETTSTAYCKTIVHSRLGSENWDGNVANIKTDRLGHTRRKNERIVKAAERLFF